MAERKASKTVNDDSVTFEFATGETVTVNPGDFSPEIQKQLILHGLSQKLGDSYSGEDADKCHAAFQGVLGNLAEGNWTARTGGGSSPRISQLAEALARATGESVEDCVTKLAGMDDDTKKAVRNHAAIKAILAEIKLERAKEAAAAAADEAGDVPGFSF